MKRMMKSMAIANLGIFFQICKPEERQTASSLMVALLSLGLGVGALTSRIWVLCIR